MSIKLPTQLMNLLENEISQMMTQMHVPGVALACIAGNQVIFAKAFGARNLEKNLPLTVDTIGPIGSCSKSYTALAIMQLVSEGKLDINDPVNKYVPFNLGKPDNPIRIFHLLTHSSGIPQLGMADVIINRLSQLEETYIPMSSLEDFYTFVNGASQWVTDKPGDRFSYLNEGYTILGEIIEKVTNMSYEDYIKEKIFNPLEMTRTTFDETEYLNDPNNTKGYIPKATDHHVEMIARPHLFGKLINPAGGIMSSVMEQANYLKMLINQGVSEEKKLLDTRLFEELMKIHIKVSTMGMYIDGVGDEGYGYGWMISHYFGEKIIIHPGGTDTGVAVLAFVPDKKVGLVTMCNCRGGEALMLFIGYAILAVLLGKNPVTDLPFLNLMQKLNTFTGVYHTYRGIMKARIENHGFLLHFVRDATKINPRVDIPLIPEDNGFETNKFYVVTGPGGKMPVEFFFKKKEPVSLYFGQTYYKKVKDL